MPDTALSIGEVINLLRDDFPDVSVSKIRFLESQGLIDPDRSNSGYRQFDANDLARLRFILQQQRDHFLPLKVIKSKLTVWERGEAGEAAVQSASALTDDSAPVDRADLMRMAKISEAELAGLESVGLIRPIAATDRYDHAAVVVAREARKMMDLGLEARHLRALRLSAEREVDLVAQLVAPLTRAANSEARSRAEEIIGAAADSMNAIHRSLLVSGLREQLPS